MVMERGPQGKLHLPAYKAGCYRQRVTDCCALCMARVIAATATAPLRHKIRETKREDEHDLVGEHVRVPRVDHSANGTELDYQEGRIEKVYVLSDETPALLSIETEEDDRIHIDLTASEGGRLTGD